MFNTKIAIVSAISAVTILTAAVAARADSSNYDKSDNRAYIPTQFYSAFGSRNDNHVHMMSGQEVFRPTAGGVYVSSVLDTPRYNDYRSASGSENPRREYNKSGSSNY